MSNNEKELGEKSKPSKALLNVGHGNFVATSRIVAVLAAGSLPTKRLRERAHEENRLLDGTAGRKTRSLVITDSGHVILSALMTNKIQERLQGLQQSKEESLLGMTLERDRMEDREFAS